MSKEQDTLTNALRVRSNKLTRLCVMSDRFRTDREFRIAVIDLMNLLEQDEITGWLQRAGLDGPER